MTREDCSRIKNKLNKLEINPAVLMKQGYRCLPAPWPEASGFPFSENRKRDPSQSAIAAALNSLRRSKLSDRRQSLILINLKKGEGVVGLMGKSPTIRKNRFSVSQEPLFTV